MKVIEKDTDRTAEVNIFVEGQVPALKEYNEHIDPKDNAICCYVALEEGHKPRIGGQFSGTTLAMAYDTIVDGVLRKASSYAAKAVSVQKKKKIDTAKFLYKTSKGIIDTDITVAPLLNTVTTQDDAPETIGTIELRLYITRQLGLWHDIGEVKKYYTVGDGIEGKQAGSVEQKVSYKVIPPTSRMSFETNAALLEDRQPSLQQRRADAKRPDTEPWAIFRFHYRSQEDILAQNMKMSHDPNSRKKAEPRTLFLNPVPPLQLGDRPRKNDGDASSRSSSPMPSSKPSTPVRSAQPTSRIFIPTEEKPRPNSNSTDATTMIPITEQANTTTGEAPSVVSHKSSADLETCGNSPTLLEGPTLVVKKALANREADSDASTISTSTDGDKSVDRIAVRPPEPADNVVAKVSNHPGLKARPVIARPEKAVVAAKEAVGESLQSPVIQARKPNVRSDPISGITTVRRKPDTPPVATVPAKRQTSTTIGVTPEPKRTKPVPTPPAPFTQPVVPRTPPRSPTPKPMSIERQLADQRKKLDELRKKRKETAHKQAAIDKEIAPYKQRIAEELDRLHREMVEEENAYTEEAEHYSASIEILQDFKKADGGD
ncbi:hypothetical protein ACET3X_008350 [Alternaria dauci]|uniref:Uncharacterized protein n=1 Tax=Alternaria dauci TaxID=48095 RepID=A0ABR3UA36_9PLEO